MKFPNKRLQGLILFAVAGIMATASTWAGEASIGRPSCYCGRAFCHRGTVYLRDRRFDRHYYSPPLTFRGGWYALNYPYYWGYGPTVGYYDPYDANGNYFPYPLPRR